MLAALAAIVVVLFIWRINAAAALAEADESRKNVAAYADRIGRLRAEWENNQAAKSRTQAIFNEEFLKRSGSALQSAQGIKAEYKNLDAQALSRLTRALFESPVPLKSFSVERKGDQAADASLEIVW
jgi:hypothetical protein